MTDEIQQPAEGSQVIEPQTGELNTQDPNQNGGLPVMTPETIAAAQQPDATLYTLLDNGEYQEQQDILYPPGTKFYFKHPDGTYSDANIEIGPDITQPEITEEFMIAKATEFMELRGYKVLTPEAVIHSATGCDSPVTESAQVNELKSQVSALKDELAAYRKPTSELSMAKIELGVMFAKLRSLIASHFPAQHLIDEAHGIVTKIEAKL